MKYTTDQFSLNSTYSRLGVVSGVTYEDNGFRFQNVTIDITEFSLCKDVYLYIYGNGYSSGGVVNRLYVEDNLNPSTFTDLADFDARTKTATYKLFTANTIQNTWIKSIDLLGLFQGIMDNEAWASGNSLVVFWTRISGNWKRECKTYDSDPTKAPYLEFTFYSTYYYTFYHNNNNGYYFESSELSNGTQIAFVDTSITLLFKSVFNGSYVFSYYNNNLTGNSTNNPYEYLVTEDCGNITVWAYSEDTPEATPYTYARFYYTMNSTSKTVTVYNNSTTNQGYFSYYSIDWGDGNATFGDTFTSESFEYWSYGDYTINLTVTTSAPVSTDYYAEYVYLAKPEEEAVTQGIFIGSILLGALGLFGFLFFLAKKRD